MRIVTESQDCNDAEKPKNDFSPIIPSTIVLLKSRAESLEKQATRLRTLAYDLENGNLSKESNAILWDLIAASKTF